VNKKAIALKLVTNRKVRKGVVEFLKDPRGQEDPRLEDAIQPQDAPGRYRAPQVPGRPQYAGATSHATFAPPVERTKAEEVLLGSMALLF
jgi:hypothetical protein